VIHYIVIRAFALATEDLSKVERALRLLVPKGCVIETSGAEGHFGNPITIFMARLGGRAGKSLIEFLKSELSASELAELKGQINQRIDNDCNFYIRLDKQSVCNGAVRLAVPQRTEDVISIRMRIKAYPAKRENAIKIVERLLSDA
jgi:hypothetical protein